MLSLSMVVSRNALTLDDNLTCEPANYFLTWCSVNFPQHSPVYCALLLCLPGEVFKPFWGVEFLADTFFDDHKFSTESSSKWKSLDDFSANTNHLFLHLTNFLISSEGSHDDVFSACCVESESAETFFFYFSVLFSLFALITQLQNSSVGKICAENNFVFFSLRFGSFCCWLFFRIFFRLFCVRLARCLQCISIFFFLFRSRTGKNSFAFFQ